MNCNVSDGYPNQKKGRGMKEEDILIMNGTADSWQQAIHLAGETLYKNGFVKEGFGQACIDREKIYPTGLFMDTSIAIPHTDDKFVNKAGVCVLRLEKPVEFHRMDAPDDVVSTKLVLNLALHKGSQQISILQKIIAAFSNEEFAHQCMELGTDELRKVFVKYSFCEEK